MDKIKFRQFKSFLTSQPFFIWHRLEQGDSFEDTDWEANDFWSVEETTEEVESQGQVIARTFSLFDKELNKILVEENKTIAISGDLESRIKQTNDNIDSGATLLNPVFEYRGATAEPFAFDTKNGVVININYSKRTRRKDFIKAYWDISIIKEVTEVKKYYFYLPEDKIYEKGEISLIKTERLHPQKSAQSLDSVFKRTGKLKSLDVMKVVENKILQNEVVFPAIDGAIDFIEESRDAKLSNNLIHDNTAWGTNPQWNELLEEIGHPHAGISGNIFRKKEIAEEDYKDAPIWTQISKLDKAIINDKMLVDKVIKDIVNSDKVIWYDFEGFSLPFA
ncbi:MAG: hypothetical protein KAG04_01650, partial [Mycoplasmataceae bacterium]|nr:hypothetical protein [Mycoplasmataceae bacterium]